MSKVVVFERSTSTDCRICINGMDREGVENLKYLGNIISREIKYYKQGC